MYFSGTQALPRCVARVPLTIAGRAGQWCLVSTDVRPRSMQHASVGAGAQGASGEMQGGRLRQEEIRERSVRLVDGAGLPRLAVTQRGGKVRRPAPLRIVADGRL